MFQDCMSQYPTVYNQNSTDDDSKDGGLGIDLGLDDDYDKEEEESSSSSVYADGEEESKLLEEVKIVSK